MSGWTPRIGVVTFPGSLDDRDARRSVTFMGGHAVTLWHADDDVHGVDAVILPGGFSYGDYLRTGAIARFGGPVLGICNGFQILCEAGLLPGALIRNRTLSFVCRWLHVRAERDLATIQGGDTLAVPIKHGEGQFVASEEELDRIERDGLVAFRYCSPSGVVDEAFNPNGAARGIAGLLNERGNVVGVMPHPEHAVDPDLGPTGGQAVFGWLFAAAGARAATYA